MKKYRLLSVFFALALLTGLLAPFPVCAADAPEITARHAILVDANYGEVLYEKDARAKAYPASITKVMTALLVCEAVHRGELSRQQMITASVTAMEGLHPDGSTANITAGETMSLEDLLYCLLLRSANEAANILAEAVSGDVATFVAEMNRRALELGCLGTHFENPHGLHSDSHYTTAYDIYLFLSAAMEQPLFREVVYTSVHEVPATNLSAARTLYNSNGLVSQWQYKGYRYDKCIGGKTGTTGEAGSCLAAAAVDGDEYLISVILGASPLLDDRGYVLDRRQFSESSALLKWGFKNFRRTTISKGDAPVAQVTVTLSQEADCVMVKPVGEFSRTLPVDLDMDDIQSDVALFQESVEAPVEEGQVLGTMTLSYGDEVYGTLDLVAVNRVERSEFLYRQAQIEAFFRQSGTQVAIAAGLILAGIVLLRLAVFRKRRRPVSAGHRGRYSGKK